MKMTNLKSLVPSKIKVYLAGKLNLKPKSVQNNLFGDLENVPRYTRISANIEGKNYEIPDSASFMFMYEEIFKGEIYKFKTQNEKPYIIDGGANIGLAILYLKQLYPESEIVAFEPDPEIFNILRLNLTTHGFDRVNIINKGLWDCDTNLNFLSEGADAGLLKGSDHDCNSSFEVPVVSLKPYLNKPVDFLKLDIEGAETAVIKDIAKDLKSVKRIFVEYHSFLDEKQTLDEILKILKEANFRLYISSPGIASKRPFIKINTYNNMDMQLNIFGIKQI